MLRLAAAGLVGALLVLRPVAQGVPLRGTVAFWAFVLAAVVLPGMILQRAFRPARRDLALMAGQGATLGLALHGLASLAGLALRTPWLGEVAPVVLALAALAWSRRAGPKEAAEEEEPGAARWVVALFVVAAAAVLVQPLFSARDPSRPVPVDLLFHAGNAGEMRHRWPLQDARAAGLPLNYPLLSYALPAAASRWTGLPVADTLLALAPLFWIGLFVLQARNAGRVLFGDDRVGVIGAALVCFHPDPGRLLGPSPGAFNSHLATGLYGSPTTAVGLLFLLGIAIVLGGALLPPARPARLGWLALALLGLAAAVTKASVLPPAVGGLVLLAGWARLRRRDGVAPALLAALVLTATAALPTLALTRGEQTYRGLLRWGPGAVVWESGFAQALQPQSLLAQAAVAAVWALGYFGLAGLAAIAYAWLRPPALTPARVWALGVLASGAAATLALQAYGLSQLFFVYNGQVFLALFAAAGLLAAGSRRLVLAVLALAALPTLDHAARSLASSARGDVQALRRPLPALAGDYAAGLAWLRAHAAEGVVLADNPSFLLSAFGECRTFYEGGSFTPRGHEQRLLGNPEPYPDRVELQDRFLRQPDEAAARAVLARLPPGTVVRVVADAVQPNVRAGLLEGAIGTIPARRLFPASLFDLEYTSPTLHVYRLRGFASTGLRS